MSLRGGTSLPSPVRAYHGRMPTSNLPTPTLQTLPLVSDDKNLLAVLDSDASCCGGSCAL